MSINIILICCFICGIYGQVVTCDRNEIVASIGEEIQPITCTVSTVATLAIYPNLPNGLIFENNVISGTPISSYPTTIHYVSSRLTSFGITISIVGTPSSLTYGFNSLKLYMGLSFEPLIPVSNTPLDSFIISPSLPEGVFMNTTTGIIEGIVPTHVDNTDSIHYTVTGSNAEGSIRTSFYIEYIPVNPDHFIHGILGCYLSYNTDCFVESTSFYATQSYDICKNDVLIDFSDEFIAGTGGHSWTGLPISFSDYFTATFNGYIYIPTSENYTFYLKNDAGAKLYIDNSILIDNDGCKTGVQVQESVVLQQGYHYVRLLYTEKDQTSILQLAYSSQTIPLTILSSSSLIQGGIAPSFLNYSPVSLYINTYAHQIKPTYRGYITQFSIAPALPNGLTFNVATGEILGTPTVTSNVHYTVTGTGPFGSVTTTVHIIISNVLSQGIQASYSSIVTTMYVCQFSSFNKGMLQNDVERIDSTINHPSETSTTIWEGLPPSYYQYFYAVYNGYIYLNQSGNWKIKTTSTDGSRITIYNDNLIYNKWSCGLGTETTPGTIYVGNQFYIPITIEYYHVVGIHQLMLSVLSPSSNEFKIVTEDMLFNARPQEFTYTNTKSLFYINNVIPVNTPVYYTINSPSSTDSLYTVSPEFPQGISIDTTTGVISGIPTVTSSLHEYTVTLKILSTSQTYTTKVYMSVIAYSAPTDFYYKQGTASVTSVSFDFYITIASAKRLKPSVTGTVTYYSISPSLPKGLTMPDTTGIISGKPIEVLAPTVFTITAHNPVGTTSYAFTLTVPACSHGDYIILTATKGSAVYAIFDMEDTLVALDTTTAISSLGRPVCAALFHEDEVLNAYSLSIGCRTSTGCTITVMNESGYLYGTFANLEGGTTSAPTYTSSIMLLFEVAPTAITVLPGSVTQYYKTAITPIVITVDGFINNVQFTPSLPYTLHYDSITRTITGTVDIPGTYRFTVNASNSKGGVSSSFTLNIQNCIAPKSLFFITKKTAFSGTEEGFTIMSTPGNELLYTSPEFESDSVFETSLCILPTDMIISMTDGHGNGWSEGATLTIANSEGTLLYSGQMPTLSSSSTSLPTYDVFVDVVYDISPDDSWLIYNSASSAPSSDWTTNSQVTVSWEEANRNSWGLFAATTFYMKHSFDVSEPQRYPLLDIMLSYKHGICIYLNGHNVFTDNLPETFTDSILASNVYTQYLYRTISVSGEYLISGTNTLAIEYHKHSSTTSDEMIQLNVFAQVITGVAATNQNKDIVCIKRTVEGIITDSEAYNVDGHTAERAFDNILSTSWIEMDYTAYIQYQYPYDHREFINKLRIYANSENIENAPTHFELLGSNDNGVTFDVLVSETRDTIWNLTDTHYIEYYLLNSYSYNIYRLHITDTVSHQPSVEIAEIELYSCQRLYCLSSFDYTSVYYNQNSYKACGEGIMGYTSKYCSNTIYPVFGEEKNNCITPTAELFTATIYTEYIFEGLNVPQVPSFEIDLKRSIYSCIHSNYREASLSMLSQQDYSTNTMSKSGVIMSISTSTVDSEALYTNMIDTQCIQKELIKLNNDVYKNTNVSLNSSNLYANGSATLFYATCGICLLVLIIIIIIVVFIVLHYTRKSKKAKLQQVKVAPKPTNQSADTKETKEAVKI